jgi:hypothetical protein
MMTALHHQIQTSRHQAGTLTGNYQIITGGNYHVNVHT